MSETVANEIRGVTYLELADYASAAAPVLERALARDEAYSFDDVMAKLWRREMQMWVVNDCQAVAVTQIQVYPRFKALQVCWLAGDGVDEWFEDLMETLENYAEGMNCRQVEVYGRRGWKRLGEARGYQETMSVFRKIV